MTMEENKIVPWGIKYEIPSNYNQADNIFQKKIAALATDMADKAVVDCVIQTAREAGITDLYLMDREFIEAAIRKAIGIADKCWACDRNRETTNAKYCPMCGRSFEHDIWGIGGADHD